MNLFYLRVSFFYFLFFSFLFVELKINRSIELWIGCGGSFEVQYIMIKSTFREHIWTNYLLNRVPAVSVERGTFININCNIIWFWIIFNKRKVLTHMHRHKYTYTHTPRKKNIILNLNFPFWNKNTRIKSISVAVSYKSKTAVFLLRWCNPRIIFIHAPHLEWNCSLCFGIWKGWK